jgi:hypothetical protein
MVLGAMVTALLLGFTVGLFAFRVKSRWCPECGATTSLGVAGGWAPGGGASPSPPPGRLPAITAGADGSVARHR